MHILEAPRNKPLSNDSFGPATMVDYVKYYMRVSSAVSPTISVAFERWPTGVAEFSTRSLSFGPAHPRGRLHFNQIFTFDVEGWKNPSGMTSY